MNQPTLNEADEARADAERLWPLIAERKAPPAPPPSFATRLYLRYLRVCYFLMDEHELGRHHVSIEIRPTIWVLWPRYYRRYERETPAVCWLCVLVSWWRTYD